MANKKRIKKILLVEDDESLSELYCELLKQAGFKIDCAGDGEAGYAKALKGGYDVILLDIMLPKKDGISILEDLKKNKPKKENGPIVMLTNLSQEKIIKESIAAGAFCCLMKSSLTPKEILNLVKNLSSERKCETRLSE